ncbi:MAG: SpaA isopeptide-forming pilin-related protein, partial [Saezia sp.]
MPVKGTVSTEKTGEMLTGAVEQENGNDSIFVPEYTTRGIEGAVFNIIAAEDIVTPDGTVRAAAGEVVDTITTGEDGKATSKELYLGNYYAVETDVPYGFVLDETPLPFSLVYVDQHTPLVTAETGLFNERAKVAVEVIKTAEEAVLDDNGEIVYVQNPADGIVFGLFAREDIENVDGEVIIPADSLLDILTTDVDGLAVSSIDIPFAAYYVREISTHQNLVPSDTEYDVLAEYLGTDTPLVTAIVNDGVAIENYLIKGKIKVIKTDEEKNPLAGVEFTITGEATGYTTTLVSDEKGVAETGLLPYDRYSIVEIKAKEGYVLDEHEHTLLLSQDGETYEFGIVNQRIRGQIKVIKTDGKTKEPLAGVVFDVLDADGNVVATLTTGADGVAITDELVYGKYTLVEKSTGIAYVLDATPHKIFIKEHKQVVELRLENHKKQGKIRIVKTDGESKEPLAGVVFEVFNADGKVVATLTTGTDGTATTGWLDYGKYTIKEKAAKDGYVLDG